MAINDTPVTSMDEMNAVLWNYQVGDVVTVYIYRNGRQASVELTLTEDKG